MNQENQLKEELLLENQLLENFQVEELEKRYEFGWLCQPKVVVVNVNTGSTTGTIIKA